MAAQGMDLLPACTIKQGWIFAGEAVLVRLGQLQDDYGGNGGIECVAAASEDVNADLRRQVVAGGDDAVTPVYGRASAGGSAE
jgi:hypothetical protein